MTKIPAILISIVAVVALALISVVLIVDFHGNDTGILVAAIFGFTTPTIASLMVLLQSVSNAEKVAEAQTQIRETQQTVESVNRKVNGHLARLTQTVVDSAASGKPVDPDTVTQLASRTEQLTGKNIELQSKETRP